MRKDRWAWNFGILKQRPIAVRENRQWKPAVSYCSRLDRTVFWKLGYWLARKYRQGFRSLMRDHIRAPEPGRAKTWVLRGRNSRGWHGEVALRRLVTSRKGQFRWRTPDGNPYIVRDETRGTIESRYANVAFALSNA